MTRTHTLLCAAAGLALAAPLPALAQEDSAQTEAVETAGESDEAAQMDAMLAGLASMFPVEPLTEDQQSRLPQATRIVSSLIPEGSMGEMMGSMFEEMIEPMMLMGGAPSNATVAKAIGVEPLELAGLDAEQSAELAKMLDPAWEERQARQMEVFPAMMTQMMSAMEPSMRRAMSELYAINFSASELDEIEAFFATETGANFARKSFTMSSDPRVISASMEALPAMMQSIGALEGQLSDLTADLPAPRSFADLSEAEQERVTEMTGFTREEIEAQLEAAQDTDF
ncbi:DUF2059 domain-containing protein [Erythrobacter insulae]|nr:DUF2059 domain-containing protein [Erythrobacter insulae]